MSFFLPLCLTEQTQPGLHLSQRLLIFSLTALETMLSKYCATIEITENVDPKNAEQIKPPQANMIIFKANLLCITYGAES